MLTQNIQKILNSPLQLESNEVNEIQNSINDLKKSQSNLNKSVKNTNKTLGLLLISIIVSLIYYKKDQFKELIQISYKKIKNKKQIERDDYPEYYSEV